MISITINDFLITMATSLFLLGIISIGTGVFILVTKVIGGDIRTIADQAVKLAQKGIAEDVAGLVGNASSMVGALDQLVRTTTGVGIFLIFNGFILFAATYLLVNNIK